MGTTLSIAPHRLLDVGAFVTRFELPMAQLDTPSQITNLLAPDASPPFTTSETIRSEIRQLLREGGFKPAGRSKPASEYLVAAHAENRFPRINAAVDACNVASLFSGLPISLIDLDRIAGDLLRIQVCPPSTTYVFNPSGQVIDASGLLAVFDSEGPTGTPVKDAQRTKTNDETRTTLAVLWGTNALPGRTEQATRWYRELVALIPGATNEDVVLTGRGSG
jgi:DNA/RNA-binding domain of Phe-tRNA-synthetase-like protein